MTILYIASEARPFVATGGLADVAGSLPPALCRAGVDCRVVLPLYQQVGEGLRRKMRRICEFQVPLAWRSQYCGVYECRLDGVTCYLLDNEYYFKRDSVYGDFDDGERFAFFSKAVLEMLCHIDFAPDILHCNDWQSAMVILNQKLFYQGVEKLRQAKTVFTIHNIQYQGQYGMGFAGDVLGIPRECQVLLEYDGCVNLMKSAIEQCDALTTVSPTYAHEIQDPWYAHGLDPLIRENNYKLTGILNGIDNRAYDPSADPDIPVHYGAEDAIAGKRACKEALQREMGLTVDPDRMLVGMVTRLVAHKGLDLVKRVLGDLVNQGVSVAILGSGDEEYQRFFGEMQQRYPGRVAFYCGFVPALSRRIYAGADVFLMPSQSEPCGLAQMQCLRYGTLPIVRETGGLKDSITDLGGGWGNGYTFQSYNAHHMMDAVLRAQRDYRDKKKWEELVQRAMKEDFSWDRSAKEYLRLYERLLERNLKG